MWAEAKMYSAPKTAFEAGGGWRQEKEATKGHYDNGGDDVEGKEERERYVGEIMREAHTIAIQGRFRKQLFVLLLPSFLSVRPHLSEKSNGFLPCLKDLFLLHLFCFQVTNTKYEMRLFH